MLSIIVVGLIFVVIVLFPVMFAAKKLGAGKSDLIEVLIAVIASSLAVGFIVPFLPGALNNEIALFAYSLLVTGVVYKYLLDATFLVAVLIALMAVAIRFVIGLVFSAFL
ncbi:MAG TPA: hypothetical protein VIC26_06900 [Marinagarivorans sp.]